MSNELYVDVEVEITRRQKDAVKQVAKERRVCFEDIVQEALDAYLLNIYPGGY